MNLRLSAPISAPYQQSRPVTIDYVYDPLYRLTEANYSTGDYYHYTYDAVGNRLMQETLIGSAPLTTNYLYDTANRLTSVNGTPYIWDNNGNLLNDSVNTYTYDSANRLTSISGGQSAAYGYNGLGDRLTQNGVNYTLDLNTGLTQVLNDGTNQYLYGVGRIAQVNTSTEYFLGDALGSVRQLTNGQGEVTLANAYEPYGSLSQSAGSAQTSYGFTGEYTDPSGMMYLRARYYSPGIGRFQTRDTWEGSIDEPMSYNLWNYVKSNPINYTDPTGHTWCGFQKFNFVNRADFAEENVNRTALGHPIRDYLNTYTAGGIGVQCFGSNNPIGNDYNSGFGIGQITDMQARTEYGLRIPDPKNPDDKKKHAGFGLLCWIYAKAGTKDCTLLCKTPEEMVNEFGQNYKYNYELKLESVHNQNDPKWGVEYMRRRIKLVTDACRKCKPTDLYIAAALAQNGSGFTQQNIRGLTDAGAPRIDKGGVTISWEEYFGRPNNADDTRDQLILFDGVIQELRKRSWYLPEDIVWDTVQMLKKIGD